MSQTAVLVWLSASSLLPTFRAELDAFAQSRWLRLQAPRENAAWLRISGYAPDVVAELEISLEDARNAAASLEPSRALSALDQASTLLHEHPELPQSAWLMAEILVLRAEVESSAPGGADAANALRERAAALEGPRAQPFSDREPIDEGAPHAARTVIVEGMEAGDTLEWDGVLCTNTLSTTSGEHHARVARNGRLLWAGWIESVDREARLRLPVPPTVPCSPDDVGQGRFVGARAVAALHTRCESYVLAQVGAGGELQAALCERERCGKAVLIGATAERAQSDRPRAIWPYAAISGGALAIVGLVLWRSGVFDRSDSRPSAGWVYDGQKPMSFRF